MGIQETVTRNIRVAMALRGIDGDQPIAEILGVVPSAVSKKRRAKLKWTLEDVELIAHAWGMSPGMLLGDAAALANPSLAATGTDAYGASRSVEVRREFTYSSARSSATVIPFPQVSKPAREMDRLAVIRVLHPRQLNEADSSIDACSNRVKHA